MRTIRNITIALLSFLATSVVVIAAHAQSTNTVVLTLNQKSFEVSVDDQARVNLIKEIQKINPAAMTSGQLEIQMVRVTAKTGVGGAQFFLRVNNDFVDSQSLETNPDQLSAGDASTASRVELKNIERDKITEASLIIQGYSNSKIFSVEVVMGAVTEVAILGHYADQQVQMVGGADDTSVDQQVVLKPSTQALADINTRYYTPNGTVAAAVAVNPTVANQVTQTLQDAASAIRNGQSTDAAP